MTHPMTHVEVQTCNLSETETARFATITRYGQTTRRHRISAASESRLHRAIHGKFSCKWPRGNGWYASLVGNWC